jgi:hypothetical protein
MYQSNPVYFMEDVLGIKTWSGMKEIIASVWENKRTSVRACHSISKTFTAAAVGVTFLNLFKPAIVITTAPTGRQVREQIWKEVRSIYARGGGLEGEIGESEGRGFEGVELGGVCQMVQVRIRPDWYMLGFSTDEAARIEGFHAPRILWILDEAKGLPQWIYDSVEGSMGGEGARILELSTTDGADQQCPFRKHHYSGKKQWNCIKLSAFDSPFIGCDEFGEYDSHRNRELLQYGKSDVPEWEYTGDVQIADRNWILDRQLEWEQNRPEMWQTKVCGDFSDIGEYNIIPLSWVESAIDANVQENASFTRFGADIARSGSDRTVIIERQGGKVFPAVSWEMTDLMETTGRIVKYTKGRPKGIIHIDMIGIGAGVFDRLVELGHPVIGVDSAKKAYNEEEFFNLRAEMWWHTRAVFERQHKEGNVISIPNDPELIEDLTGMKYGMHSDGRTKVEKKDEFKKRFGRSPDRGDAFVYCLAYLPVEDQGIMDIQQT